MKLRPKWRERDGARKKFVEGTYHSFHRRRISKNSSVVGAGRIGSSYRSPHTHTHLHQLLYSSLPVRPYISLYIEFILSSDGPTGEERPS